MARELDRRSGSTMQNTKRVDRAIGGMDARHGHPMVAGDLPGYWRNRRRGYHAVSFVRSREVTARSEYLIDTATYRAAAEVQRTETEHHARTIVSLVANRRRGTYQRRS